MKFFILITSLIVSFSAHGINKSEPIPDQSNDQNLINKIDPKTFIKPMEMAGNNNPLWGAGTGFHWVQPRSGSGYWRSNPDGLCYNNKYGCS